MGKKQYQASHIHGSYYLDLNEDLSSPVGEHGGRHPLPKISDLAQKLECMGIGSGKTLVVAYDDSAGCFASRLWWLLRYLGHDKVAILNGGFTAWQQAGYGVTAMVPQPRKGNFTPQVLPEMLVDMETVNREKDLPGVALVDSREGDRFLGEREPIDKIAGHIPGAVNYPWREIIDAHGYILPPEAQKQRWEKLAKADKLIVYCGSGVTACMNLLSLELANINTGKLYAGSWSDWISYQGNVDRLPSC